ncbi:MurR/RpiR family transcriptional regulator [Pseudonocardia nematodicida]|uniref:MurR/RpiR family transcriptional regulator n=1 Tax=Pseudonocardia nematodicida TaxID=1206997 RepID=A0ABV1KGR7_9PSEU
MESTATFYERVTATAGELSARERAVTEFLLNRPTEAVTASAVELAALVGTSDATVVRTAQALGYRGFRELKRAVLEMLTERRDPAQALDRRLKNIGSGRVLDRVLADGADLLRRMPEAIDAADVDRAVDVVVRAQRVVAYGIGPAASTARYLATELPRLGRRAAVIETTGFRLADDLLGIGPGDAIVVFAPLRLFREIEVLVAHAREEGVPVVVVTEALGPALRDRVDVVIATPPSTSAAVGENFASWVIAHSLVLELATRDGTGSVATRHRLNRLRAEISGPGLETDVLGR